jgi:GT2 family glycosyltransferase
MTDDIALNLPPRVTIIVSPRERFEQAEMSLRACFDMTETPFEMIYVDGGSPRKIARVLKDEVERRGHTYIRRNGFLTPNDARNTALPLVTTEYIAFIDNDVVFETGWLDALIKCADETGAGLVTPTILVGPAARMPDLTIHHAGGILELETGDTGTTMYRRHGLEHQSYLEAKNDLVRHETGCTEFHVVLARRAMIEDIGPFDPNLVGFTDEIDMALAARAKGWKIFYEPESVVAYAVGKKLTWRDRPYFCVRWSEGRVMRAERYFYDKWGLAHDFERQANFLRDHRRHAFPLKWLQKLAGWRVTVTITALVCEAIAALASIRLIRPNASPSLPRT